MILMFLTIFFLMIVFDIVYSFAVIVAAGLLYDYAIRKGWARGWKPASSDEFLEWAQPRLSLLLFTSIRRIKRKRHA